MIYWLYIVPWSPRACSGYACVTGVAENTAARSALTGGELQMPEMETRHAIPISVFSWTRFSLKPVDIPSLLCCHNANLSAPLKRGRREEEGEEEGRNRENHSTALRINVVHHMQRTQTPSCAQFAITPHLEWKKWKCERQPSTRWDVFAFQ